MNRDEEDRGDRYSLAGLLALYEHEPSLRDIYVEGRTDAGLLTWFFRQVGVHPVTVFPIDDRVVVPRELPLALGLEVNARGRAVAFGVQCERALGKAQISVTVVVDADFAHVVGPFPIEGSCVFWTDGPATENYVLDEAIMEKVLRVSLHQHPDVKARDVLDSIVPALTDIYATRLVLHLFRCRCIRKIETTCVLLPDRSHADVRALLQKSVGSLPKEEWPAELDSLEKMVRETRDWAELTGQNARGHDIALLLIEYLDLTGPLANVEALEAAMRSCLTVDHLVAQQLFRTLATRLAA